MISLIIPAFNAVQTIGETIDSVLGQTVPPDEIVVVDDGSTDNTADHPALGAPSVRVLRQANAGAAAALNRGIAVSRGEFIAFLDSDDLWIADKLASQVDALRARPHLAGAAGHMASFACPSSTPAERQRWHVPPEPQPGWVLGALLARRQSVNAIGPFPEQLRIGYHIEWLARLRRHEDGIDMQPQVVLRRRIRAGSLSQRSPARDAGYLAVARLALERRRGRGVDEGQ